VSSRSALVTAITNGLAILPPTAVCDLEFQWNQGGALNLVDRCSLFRARGWSSQTKYANPGRQRILARANSLVELIVGTVGKMVHPHPIRRGHRVACTQPASSLAGTPRSPMTTPPVSSARVPALWHKKCIAEPSFPPLAIPASSPREYRSTRE
jgi:hypothetical protein